MSDQRKYTVNQIERMRKAIAKRLYPLPAAGLFQSFFLGEQEQHLRHIEDALRTYMANGTDPAELEALE